MVYLILAWFNSIDLVQFNIRLISTISLLSIILIVSFLINLCQGSLKRSVSNSGKDETLHYCQKKFLSLSIIA